MIRHQGVEQICDRKDCKKVVWFQYVEDKFPILTAEFVDESGSGDYRLYSLSRSVDENLGRSAKDWRRNVGGQ